MTNHSITEFPRHALHPFCNVCGWRKGGNDSWNGRACKCGHSEPPMPDTGMDAIEAGIVAALRKRAD